MIDERTEITADDISIENPLHATVGLAYALAIIGQPKKREGELPAQLTKRMIAHVLDTFDTLGLAIVHKGEAEKPPLDPEGRRWN